MKLSVVHLGLQLWSMLLAPGVHEHPREASLKMPNKFSFDHLGQFFHLQVNGEEKKKNTIPKSVLTIGHRVYSEFPFPGLWEQFF